VLGDVVAVVPAAGRGLRLGEATPKAFVQLAGKTLLRRTVDALSAVGDVGLIVLVVPQEMLAQVTEEFGDVALAVSGGVERTHSVRLGMHAALGVVPDAKYVLVHDAARVLTPPQLVRDVVAALRGGAEAVVPVLPLVDTIKTVDANGMVTGTPDRSSLRAVQTPQGFRVEVLVATDDAGLVESMGVAVHTVLGDPMAFKITTPLDLRLAQTLLERP